MLNIKISPKYLEEKSYTFSILFNEILGINYKIEITHDQKDYLIYFEDKEIIFEDHFFNNFPNDLSYLSKNNLPDNIIFIKNEFAIEDDIPIIFGTNNFNVENKNKIICGIDIFASVFFLLSRWEEYVIEQRDRYGRFSYKNSLMGKKGILHRPIVNEYVEFLWNMLKYLGYNFPRKKHNFELIATHDVDQPIRLISLKILTKAIGKSIFINSDYKGAFKDIYIYGHNKFNNVHDHGNSYQFLIDTSNEAGIKSIFNLQNSKRTKYDWGYKNDSKFMKNVIKIIKDSGHEIGYHPGYYTINDPELWKKEYDELCRLTQTEIKFGRQHFLRFNMPETWQLWEDNNMEGDSSMGFPGKEGFRCGICTSYSVFNILSRKKLKLKEYPLILMEKTLMMYQRNNGTTEFLNKAKELINTTKKYNGTFVLLWHNSSFDHTKYTKEFYKKLINSYKES